MIALMKKLMNSIFGKFVIMIIIAGMAFWGVDQMVAQMRNGMGNNLIASDGRATDIQALDRRVETLLRNMNANAERPITKAEALEQGVIDQLIALETTTVNNLGYANSIGVEASTESVIDELKTIDIFKNPLTGELDLKTYQGVLDQNRITRAEYQRQISDDLIMRKLRGAATAAVNPPTLLTDIQARYIAETRDIEWFILDGSKATPPVPPTDEEVRAYYDDNIETLKHPERRAIDLFQVSAVDFTGQVEVTEQDIATIYEATKSERFAEPDQRTFVELVFSDREAAKTAFGLLAGGADPASLSGVISSEARTGPRESVQDPTLREAMFGPGRQSGALFGPKDRGDGTWLVARLVSVQPGAVKPIQEVAEQIRTGLARERAEQLLYTKLEELDLALGAGYDLARIGQDLGVPVISFAPVDKNGLTDDGVPVMALMNAADALQDAFTLPVGEAGERFDADGVTTIASVRSVVEPFTPAFEDIQEQVRASLVAERANKSASAFVTQVVEAIRSGDKTLAASAAEAGNRVERTPQPISRSTAAESGLPSAAVGAAFTGREGDVFSFPSQAGDRYMIMQIKSVTPPSEADMEEFRSLAQTSLAQSLENDLQAALQAEIQNETSVKVNKSGINAYKNSLKTDQ